MSTNPWQRLLADLGATAEDVEALKEGIASVPVCPLCGESDAGHDQAACDEKMANWRPTGLVALIGESTGDGLPYIHTFRPPEPTWVSCSACDGTGGAMVAGEWQDCDGCQGEEGWLSSPATPPSMTIVDWPPPERRE